MKRVKGSSTMRRSTAWILSAALVLSACPVTAEAEELAENGSESVSETDQAMDESETAEQTEDEHLNEGENTNASEEEKENQIQESSVEDDIKWEAAQEASTQEALSYGGGFFRRSSSIYVCCDWKRYQNMPGNWKRWRSYIPLLSTGWRKGGVCLCKRFLVRRLEPVFLYDRG